MKLRVKFCGQSRPVDFGDKDTSSVTLKELKESVSETLLLQNGNVELSLNKIDFLTGDEITLADFGIVPGDLVHVIAKEGEGVAPAESKSSAVRQQPLSSWNNNPDVVPLDRNQHAHPNDEGSSEQEGTSQAVVTSSSVPHSVAASSSQESETEGMETDDQTPGLVQRSLKEPLVIGESTPSEVPALLRELYLCSEVKCPNDALFVLLHALMIEAGFSLPGGEPIACMPPGWKKSGFYMCGYEYILTPDVSPQCSMVAVPIGSSMVVHGLSKTDRDFKTDHLHVKAENYVRDISQEEAAAAYRSLDRASKLFKESICLTLQNNLATSAGFQETQGLLSLPCEVRMRLLSFLDVASICSLGQTCYQWRSLYKDNIIWRRLYIQSFDTPSDSSLSRNWYEMFRDRYQQFKAEQEQRRLLFEDFYVRPRFPVFPFAPFNPSTPFPFHPRFLGGEHDLNPEYATGIPDFMRDQRINGNIRGPSPLSDPFGGRRQPPLPDPFQGGRHQRRGGGRGNLTGSPFFGQGGFM